MEVENKEIYNYDRITKEYISTSYAELNPVAKKEGKIVYMLPANATFDEPPAVTENKVAVYTDGWQIKDDFRGMYKVNEDMQPELITAIGSLDDGYVAITPEQAYTIQADPLYYIYDNGQIIVNPNYDADKLAQAKAEKYAEALNGAKHYIESEAYYQFNKSNSIEATDGNIGKFTAYALGFTAGAYESVQWTSKEDNVLTLNQEQVQTILFGLGAIQSNVWNVQYVGYKTAIDEAQTIEEVEGIEIDYGKL